MGNWHTCVCKNSSRLLPGDDKSISSRNVACMKRSLARHTKNSSSAALKADISVEIMLIMLSRGNKFLSSLETHYFPFIALPKTTLPLHPLRPIWGKPVLLPFKWVKSLHWPLPQFFTVGNITLPRYCDQCAWNVLPEVSTNCNCRLQAHFSIFSIKCRVSRLVSTIKITQNM